MSRLGETAERVCHPPSGPVRRFLQHYDVRVRYVRGVGWAVNAEIFGIRQSDPWECQPGGAANEAVNIFSRKGSRPHSSTWAPLSTVISIQMCRNYLGECPPADQTKDGACKGFRLTTTEPFSKAINQKGWHTYYDPIALVPYMLRVDGTPGFIHVRRRGFDLHPRVVLRLAVESGLSVHVVD